MKDVITKNKNLIYELSSKEDVAEERLSHLENGSI